MTENYQSQSPIVLAAGGTGGHVFPAEAVALELKCRGWKLVLITDKRGFQYGNTLARLDQHIINAGTPLLKGPISKIISIFNIGIGIRQASNILRQLNPAAVIGFGGYPSIPTMIAASRNGLATAIHEQNAVMGRANRFLAPKVLGIATSFENTKGIRKKDLYKVNCTGNPTRSSIKDISNTPYEQPGKDDIIYLLVTGGSQGARVFSKLVPQAVGLLRSDIRQRIVISHHCRPEDKKVVISHYREIGVIAEVQSFFEDLPARLKQAHLVICRAGASTVAELATSGRPSILIPYPSAIDDHQSANGAALSGTGGAIVMNEGQTTAKILSEQLTKVFTNPDMLSSTACAARKLGRSNASKALADIVENLALLKQLPDSAASGSSA